jgi:hypothetical protein
VRENAEKIASLDPPKGILSSLTTVAINERDKAEYTNDVSPTSLIPCPNRG